MKAFISYSSANDWMLVDFFKLIKGANPDFDFFCSFEGKIKPGDNYREIIFRNLKRSDVFIAILSQEYWKSKYCIIELGAAYERYCFDETHSLRIIPLLLPPLSKERALSNTPLGDLEVKQLSDAKDMLSFVHFIADEKHKEYAVDMDISVAAFINFINQHVLSQQSLFSKVNIDVFFDERPGYTYSKPDVISIDKNEDDEMHVTFDLNKPGYVPSFASLAMMYYDELNLNEYLKYDTDAVLRCDIDNTQKVLNTISIELKYGDNNIKIIDEEFRLNEGQNALEISLGKYDTKRLSEISQICFVIHPESMNKKNGEITISNLKIEFKRRNLFEEEQGEETH